MSIDCVLVCGGEWHDFDHVRRELLHRLARYPQVRPRVFADYDCAGAIADAGVLITYTCYRAAAPDQQAAIADLVARGGRWLALHSSNVGIDPDPPSPITAVLGSRFLAHPPIQPFPVEVTRPDHPLVAGIDEFTVNDEIYVCEVHRPVEVLLHTRFGGATPGFEPDHHDDDGPRPVLYLRHHGAGQVCYFALGHIDPQHPGSWASPVFDGLLDRLIGWAVQGAAADR